MKRPVPAACVPQTSAIRLQVLSHSILSFLYNTATIGIVVTVIAS